jgi:hypothetical protein
MPADVSFQQLKCLECRRGYEETEVERMLNVHGSWSDTVVRKGTHIYGARESTSVRRYLYLCDILTSCLKLGP